MRLPFKTRIINNVNLFYIDVQAIIELARTLRKAKIDSYISAVFPDSQDFAFIEKGELINAGRIIQQKRSPLSVNIALQRMKKREEDATLYYSEVNEELLSILIWTFFNNPKYKNLSSKYTSIRKIIDVIKKNKLDSFVELEINNGLNYITFKNGILNNFYFCEDIQEQQEDIISRNDPELLTESTLQIIETSKSEIFVNIYNEPTEIISQLTPNQLKLLENMINSVIDKLSVEIGTNNGVELFRQTHEEIIRDYPEVKEITIGNEKVDFSNISSIDQKKVIDGTAGWLNKFIDKVTINLGDQTYDMIFNSIKDLKYALENINFFEKSYLKTLL